jgi:hypothetical protein
MSIRSRAEAAFNVVRAPVAQGGPSRGVAAAQTLAVAGIVGTGATLAIGSAVDLYRSRSAQANQFQNELLFPEDLVQSNRSFYMSFSFMKYEKRSIQNSPFLRSEGTVRLPLPEGLRDNLSVTYGTPSLGPIVGAALDSVAGRQIAGGNIEQTVAGAAGALGGALLGGVEGAAASVLNSSGGGLATQTGQAAQAYLGLAVNPYQTVLFEKPEFKTHNFSWKILPKTPKESDIARNIYRTFQFHASPGVSRGPGVFFSYPSMAIVSLFPSSEFLYRFKPCVIKSVSVNYAGAGAPSFFKRTDAPTAMTLSIQLQEIEYWTANDYTRISFSDRDAEANLFLAQQAARAAATPLTSVGD